MQFTLMVCFNEHPLFMVQWLVHLDQLILQAWSMSVVESADQDTTASQNTEEQELLLHTVTTTTLHSTTAPQHHSSDITYSMMKPVHTIPHQSPASPLHQYVERLRDCCRVIFRQSTIVDMNKIYWHLLDSSHL